jgi:hypothetical protein
MRAAQEIPEHRFRLIIRMMSEKDFAAAMFSRTVREKNVPLVAGGGFHRFPMRSHPLAHIGPADFARQAELRSQPLDEQRVRRGGASAQPVVEMADDKIVETVF